MVQHVIMIRQDNAHLTIHYFDIIKDSTMSKTIQMTENFLSQLIVMLQQHTSPSGFLRAHGWYMIAYVRSNM